jgi:hypothetical protein
MFGQDFIAVFFHHGHRNQIVQLRGAFDRGPGGVLLLHPLQSFIDIIFANFHRFGLKA